MNVRNAHSCQGPLSCCQTVERSSGAVIRPRCPRPPWCISAPAAGDRNVCASILPHASLGGPLIRDDLFLARDDPFLILAGRRRHRSLLWEWSQMIRAKLALGNRPVLLFGLLLVTACA